MQPKMMARQTRALSWVLPGGHTQKMDRRMSASVSCNQEQKGCSTLQKNQNSQWTQTVNMLAHTRI